MPPDPQTPDKVHRYLDTIFWLHHMGQPNHNEKTYTRWYYKDDGPFDLINQIVNILEEKE